MREKVGIDKTNAYTVIRLISKSNPRYHIELGHFYASGQLFVDGNYLSVGRNIGNGVYEFDLSSFGNDFYIWGVQPNFDLSKLQLYGNEYRKGQVMAQNTTTTRPTQVVSSSPIKSVPSAYINRSWLELNAVRNGVSGTVIHMDMGVKNAKGKKISVISFLDRPKGVGVKDRNGKYCNTQGNVCTYSDVICNNEHTTWKDFQLFLPNDEIHPVEGKNTYYLHTFLFLDGKSLGDIWSGNFDMTIAPQIERRQNSDSGSQNGFAGGTGAVKGKGYLGKGQTIHVMPATHLNRMPAEEKAYCFCNAVCAPVKIYVKYNRPNNPQPNNPFMQNMVNQVSGWSLSVQNVKGATYMMGIKDYSIQNGCFVFRDNKGITVTLAMDLSYAIVSAGAFGSVKYEYHIPESDYNIFSSRLKDFLALASLYEQKIEVPEEETFSTRERDKTPRQEHYKGIRVKEYPVKYIVDDCQVWCKECNDFDYTHYHRWRRY